MTNEVNINPNQHVCKGLPVYTSITKSPAGWIFRIKFFEDKNSLFIKYCPFCGEKLNKEEEPLDYDVLVVFHKKDGPSELYGATKINGKWDPITLKKIKSD